MQFPRYVYFILGVMELFALAFSVFGLLASKEPGVHVGWTIGYALAMFSLVTACCFTYIAFKRSDA